MARRPAVDPSVLSVFKREHGPFCPSQVAEILGIKKTSVSSSFGRLIFSGEIVFVGYASDLGDTQMRARTKLYGLPGAPRLVQKAATHEMSYEERLRFAPPCRGVEFRPLQRDPFAHMKLALATKR